jgi:hypothetical protein
MIIGATSLPGGVQRVVIAELKATECTVVEWKSDQTQQTPERVQAHLIDFVRFPEPAEFIIVALGAIREPLEKSEKNAIVIAIRAAMRAMKRGAAEDAAEYAPALARIHLSAGNTACIDSSKKQSGVRLAITFSD